MLLRVLLLAAIYGFPLSQSLNAQSLTAQSNTTQSNSTQSNPTTTTQEAASLQAMPCRYIAVSDALPLLQQLLGRDDLRIAADARSNSIFVSGSKESIERCKQLLSTFDLPPTEVPTQVVNLQAEFLKKNTSLITQYAASSGVEFAMDEETGIVMLKGKKEGVQQVQTFIDRLKTIGDAISKSAPSPSSVAIRVLWLTNGRLPPEMVTENDPKLQQIIDRLAKQGIKGLAVGMQLLARCDPSPELGHCMVNGGLDLENSHEELVVDARFKQTPGSKVFSGKVDIRATRITEGGSAKSNVQVDINAETNKYYVLSSAPIGNQHSVFVVQLLDEF